jgi:hypothetical protein
MSSFSLNGKIKDEMAGVVQVACQSGRTDIIQVEASLEHFTA